jgi:dimethylhistidine N-methyltransferase
MHETNHELRRVLADLRKDPAQISPIWFYNAAGSALFEAITRLESYYPTDSELSILEDHGREIGSRIGSDATVIELGSGSAEKATLLLSALEQPGSYRPIDVSESALVRTREAMGREFPDLDIRGTVGDFTSEKDLKRAMEEVGPDAQQVFFFPGSTIGNFEPDEAREFLSSLRKAAADDALFLLGVDLIKPVRLLLEAYDDPAGVTAAFNRNILSHLNDRFDANFRVEAWSHEVEWNSEHQRVEMWLRCEETQSVDLAGERLMFEEGDRIHTENAYKWSIEGARQLGEAAGWRLEEHWTDGRDRFAILLFRSLDQDG